MTNNYYKIKNSKSLLETLNDKYYDDWYNPADYGFPSIELLKERLEYLENKCNINQLLRAENTVLESFKTKNLLMLYADFTRSIPVEWQIAVAAKDTLFQFTDWYNFWTLMDCLGESNELYSSLSLILFDSLSDVIAAFHASFEKVFNHSLTYSSLCTLFAHMPKQSYRANQVNSIGDLMGLYKTKR